MTTGSRTAPRDGVWADVPASHRVALVVILACALMIRLANLTHPMRYDEAFTVVYYTSHGLRSVLNDYSQPNNHIFHSVLVWISTHIFGYTTWAVRLPALIAGMLLVPATYVVARRLGHASGALIAAALVAVLPSLVFYSVNARGYTFLCLLFLLLVLLAQALADESSARLWVAFALLIALGMYTAPVMMYPAGGAILWLVIERARRGRQSLRAVIPPLCASLAAAGVLTVLLYSPVLLRSGLRSITGNRYVTPLPWPEFTAELRTYGRVVYESVGLGVPGVIGVVIAIAVLMSLTRNDDGRRTERLTLAVAIVVSGGVLIVAKRRPPPGRVLLYVATIVSIYAGIGFASLVMLALRSTRARRLVMTAAAVVITIGAGTWQFQKGVVDDSDETDGVGLRDAPEMAAYLLSELRPTDRLVLKAVGASLEYYMWTTAGRRVDDFSPRTKASRLVVIVDTRHRQTLDYVRLKNPTVPWDQYKDPKVLRYFNNSHVLELRAADALLVTSGPRAGSS